MENSNIKQSMMIRTLCLRNLFLGYKCGMVFPAGVGLDLDTREIQPTGCLRDSAGRLRCAGVQVG